MRIGPPGHLTRRLAAHPMPHLRPVRRSLHATHAVATLLRLDGRSAHGSARARESARPLATHFDLRRATNPNDRVPADAASPRGDYEAPKGRAAGARQRTIATHPAPTSVKRSSYALTARFHASVRPWDGAFGGLAHFHAARPGCGRGRSSVMPPAGCRSAAGRDFIGA